MYLRNENKPLRLHTKRRKEKRMGGEGKEQERGGGEGKREEKHCYIINRLQSYSPSPPLPAPLLPSLLPYPQLLL